MNETREGSTDAASFSALERWAANLAGATPADFLALPHDTRARFFRRATKELR